MSTSPIYDQSCLTDSDNPVQTLEDCRSMLSLLGMKDLQGDFGDAAACGISIVMHQVNLALEDIAERYEFVDKKSQ